ncbi:MAG: emp24/gp25L/p24 family protein [Conexivisphaerales archaeon]
MAEEKPKGARQAPKSRRMVWIVAAVVVVVLVAVGGVAAYYLLQQPNIQLTAFNVNQPVQSPVTQTVQDQGTVSGSRSFSYTSTLAGSYYLTFDNSFSTFSSKYVTVNYSVAGKQYSTAVSLNAGQTKDITVALIAGGQVTGTFSTTGGSGNDVNFYIVGNTCSEQVTFSFILVNSGPVSGYANVSFRSDGSSIWTNKYYVPAGQQSTVEVTRVLSDCGNHVFSAVVTSQQKG